jgi:hypothetical protein
MARLCTYIDNTETPSRREAMLPQQYHHANTFVDGLIQEAYYDLLEGRDEVDYSSEEIEAALEKGEEQLRASAQKTVDAFMARVAKGTDAYLETRSDLSPEEKAAVRELIMDVEESGFYLAVEEAGMGIGTYDRDADQEPWGTTLPEWGIKGEDILTHMGNAGYRDSWEGAGDLGSELETFIEGYEYDEGPEEDGLEGAEGEGPGGVRPPPRDASAKRFAQRFAVTRKHANMLQMAYMELQGGLKNLKSATEKEDLIIALQDVADGAIAMAKELSK